LAGSNARTAFLDGQPHQLRRIHSRPYQPVETLAWSFPTS
jgi:hypothetical protein